ncbi:hypothetical protein YC2023_041718 [Brassica napus]
MSSSASKSNWNLPSPKSMPTTFSSRFQILGSVTIKNLTFCSSGFMHLPINVLE